MSTFSNLKICACEPLSDSVIGSEAKDIVRKVRSEESKELLDLLELRNGFYAFDRALHVFSLGVSADYSLLEWNDNSLWRSVYGDDIAELFFFAQDIFGDQFAIRRGRGGILKFESETCEVSEFSNGIENWWKRIVADPDYEVGYSIAEQWREAFGEIPPKSRLLPSIPFVLGGDYEIKGLRAVDSADMMRFRARLSQQIRDIPDGGSVSLEFCE